MFYDGMGLDGAGINHGWCLNVMYLFPDCFSYGKILSATSI